MHFIVTFFAKYLIFVLFVALLIPLVKLKTRADKLQYVLFVVVSAIITVVLMKIASALHNDPRPFVRDGVTPYFSSSQDNGFPSHHTVGAVFSALIMLRYYRKTGIVLLVLAVLIGTARVIGGVHHAQDIIGGIFVTLLGVAAGYGIAKLISAKVPSLNK